ncbi:1-phosphofructokinase family hexose kinase [Zhihengliuella salsuginis]|uniref:1-phosphofructokinase n=1 Tax=Zhihengliuella salsuginis TaxID=578222 RepID=A0ABQ3GJP1_9MICC|nr:1-phosphofructokinase family hexose kinase [Zhihengliuella salsuginis]GHD06623.1 1-phosphofructokinase [Zhihengliuella salsuginis]
MIVTLTANPSLDRTIELDGRLERGGVQRAGSTHAQPAGKGVNVSRAVAAAGSATLALLPGDTADPLVLGLDAASLPYRAMPIGASLRSNITLTEPDGTTTKINEPGPHLDADQQRELGGLVADAADGAAWLVLAGSLPPGVEADFYARLTATLRRELGGRCPKIAVDTSGAPLAALFDGGTGFGAAAVPTLLKPNADELAELVGGTTEAELEADPHRAVAAARELIGAGAEAVLATLGAAGAVLVTASGAWQGTHAPVTARSTVGAGDSSLAGFVLAESAGLPRPDCLRRAVAYGAAAASLPGSTIPTPSHTTEDAVRVVPLTGKDQP